MNRTSMPISLGNASRHGVSLIEMVAVMGIIGTAMGGGVLLLALTLRMDREAVTLRQERQGRDALAQQFREDIHRVDPADIAIGDPPTTLTLTGAGIGPASRVEYRAENGIVHRQAWLANDQLASQERYRCGLGNQIAWETSDHSSLLRLKIVPPAPTNESAPWTVPPFEILAQPGRLADRPPPDS